MPSLRCVQDPNTSAAADCGEVEDPPLCKSKMDMKCLFFKYKVSAYPEWIFKMDKAELQQL